MTTNDLSQLIYNLALDNYPMTSLPLENTSPYGLRRTLYTMLDIIDLEGTKLVKLRHPIPKDMYTGPWSNKDSRWTPALLEKAHHTTTANTSIFFMPLDLYT